MGDHFRAKPVIIQKKDVGVTQRQEQRIDIFWKKMLLAACALKSTAEPEFKE